MLKELIELAERIFFCLLALRLCGILGRLRRKNQKHASRPSATTAVPPTVPPTMAPIFEELLLDMPGEFLEDSFAPMIALAHGEEIVGELVEEIGKEIGAEVDE